MGTTTKANIYGLAVACAILAVHVSLSSSSAVDFAAGGAYLSRSECGGSVGECLLGGGGGEEEEWESTRRILAARRYISYGALRRNTVPCSRRGASYYNCRPGAPANPYSRGCSAIARCRR